MYKTLFLSLLSTLFIGCSSNSALTHFNKEEIATRAMQHTKKTDLIYKKEIKVILWATYLNNIDSKRFDLDNETFLVSVYFADSKVQDINKKNYRFTLTEKKSNDENEEMKIINTNPISIKEIRKDNKIYKDILGNNGWGKYYLLEFKEQKKKYKLNLKLENPKTTSVQLNFEKS